MGTLTHFKDLYLEAFDDCRPLFIVFLLKVYSLFCLLMLFMAIYAFFYRAFTGFDF